MLRVCLLFFFSGFAALVYELLWFRQLGFIFGNTIYAATTVLTAYMIGLAGGAWWIGQRAHKVKNPIRLFGLLEVCIGLYALMMPWLFLAVRYGYRWVYQNVSESLLLLTPVRFGLAVLVMLLPTMLMGATLPLLAQGLTRKGRFFASRLSWLYGINTLGAVSGLVVSGFFLIPNLGLAKSNWFGVAANLTIGLLAWLLAAKLVPASIGKEGVESEVGDSRPIARTLLLASCLSGFLALSSEVVWFRALILIFGSTTYSFCVMLSVFLAGIAVGSLLLGWLSDRVRSLELAMSVAFLGMGGWTILSMYQFNGKADFLLQYLLNHSFSWSSLIQAKALITLSFLSIPTLCFGMAFAIVAKAVREVEGSSGSAVATVYTVNTVGAVAGSLVGGFLLLPWLGIEKSLYALALIALCGALVLALRAHAAGPSRWIPASLTLIIFGGSFLFPPVLSKDLMASGPYFSPWHYVQNGESTFWDQKAAEHLLLFKEGMTAVVAVKTTQEGSYSFTANGKVEADTQNRGMAVQRLIGHLPMLFHPNPKRAVNIGLGAGVTFGSLACYPLDHTEVVEIEPNVQDVARVWGEFNHEVLDRDDVIVTINDGRNHLFCTTNKYDVITSDPFEPVVSGAASLFTREHFAQARRRLAAGGIMCQWLPMYEMSRSDFFAIMRTFADAFPRSSVFFTGTDTLMLGFSDDFEISADAVRAKFDIPAVRDSLASIGITEPHMILGMFVADLTVLLEQEGDDMLNTDDWPIIEFRTPKSALHYTTDLNNQVLRECFTEIPEAYLRGFSEVEVERIQNSHTALKLVLEASVLRSQGDAAQAFGKLKEAQDVEPDHPIIRNEMVSALLASANQLRGSGYHEQAAIQYHMALKNSPDSFSAMFHLFHLHMMAGREEQGLSLLDHAQKVYPNSATFWSLRAKYEATKSNMDAALEYAGKAIELESWRYDIWRQVADYAAIIGDEDRQRAALERAELPNPRKSYRRRW